MSNIPTNAWAGNTTGGALSAGKGASKFGLNVGQTATFYSDPSDSKTKLKIWDFGYSNLNGYTGE